MKTLIVNKTFIILILFLIESLGCNSQSKKYGIVFGINSTNINSSSGTFLFSEDSFGLDGYNFGVYFDYKLNNKFGIKNYLIYNSENENYSRILFTRTDFEVSVKSIQFSTLLKYHFNKEYFKGIYMMIGPRITNIVKTNSIWNVNGIEDFHQTYNFGFQIGFGFTLYKFINTELIGDYGFSNIFNIESLKANSYNLKLNFNIDIDFLFK